jgi:hypothetical protein
MKAWLVLSILLCACCACGVRSRGPSGDADAALGPPDKPLERRTAVSGEWDSTAKMIAGLKTPSIASMTPEQKAEWKRHAWSTDSEWKLLKARYLGKIDAWAGQNLKDAAKDGVAFYPFGGPDAATLLAVYPSALEYIMIGLEPAGKLPDSIDGYTPEYWSGVRQSLRSAVALGFFKTEEMEEDFSGEGVGGITPVLLLYIARSGFTVEDVVAVQVSPRGGLVAAPDAPPVKREVRGVTIFFSGADGQQRKLTYLGLNLSDTVKKRPDAMRFLEQLHSVKTLLKSASYLMHKSYFSTIRRVILTQSDVVVEDDSGIPFRFFHENEWDVQLFGTYEQPIKLFSDWQQDDLKDAYAVPGVQPLGFGFGYRYKPDTSNLLLARRKSH